MPENRLEILLTLEDEATDKLNRAAANVKTQTKEIEATSKQATKSISEGFKEANKQIHDYRKAMLVVGVAVAGIIATTKDWAKTNDNTKKAYDDLEKATKGLSASIGSLLAPTITGLSKIVVQSTEQLTKLFDFLRESYAGFFEQITFSTQFYAAFFAGLKTGQGIAESYAIAMKTAEQATRDLTEEFQNTIGLGGNNNIMDLGTIIISTEDAKKQLEALRDLAIKIEEGIAEAAAKRREKEKKLAQDSFLTITSLLAKLAEENKAAAIAYKILMTGRAIINTAEAITEALPNIPLAALVAAAGAAEIAIINSQNFAGGTDTVPANLTPGEMVFPSSMASAIRRGDISVSGPGGGSMGNTINIFIEKAEMSSNQAIEQVAEMLGFSIERSLRLGRGI